MVKVRKMMQNMDYDADVVEDEDSCYLVKFETRILTSDTIECVLLGSSNVHGS